MATPKVKKQIFSDMSTSGDDSAFDVMEALRTELDNAKLAAVGFKTASVVNDFANIADAGFSALNVTCLGAALGDYAVASLGLDIQGMCINAQVTATDVVTVNLYNESGGAIDLASTTVRVAAIAPERAGLIGLQAKATFDAAEIADGAFQATTVTVTGAALGDFAVASLGVDVTDIFVSAAVTSANTVSVVLHNETGGALDLASTTLRVFVLPKAPVLGSISLGAVVNDFASIGDAAGSTLNVACPGAELGQFALASLSVDVVDLLVSAHVKTNGVISVRVQNETGDAVDLASCVVRVAAIPAPALVARQFTIDSAS